MELNQTFDKVAELYNQYRNCYVKQIFDDILSYSDINADDSLIEVGIGTGQVTKPFLETGAFVTAIELGKNLSDFCRNKFRDYPNFSVITSKFEDCEISNESTELVYSASAFHWIPEEIGYTKVYSVLKPGGIFARFANHPFPDKGKPEMCEAIQDVYKAYASFRGGKYSAPIEYTEESAKNRAFIAKKYGFRDIQYKIYHNTRTFTADDYIGLLGTYSDNIAMEASVRTRFFGEIHDIIQSFGGSITIYDTLDLQLARK